MYLDTCIDIGIDLTSI